MLSLETAYSAVIGTIAGLFPGIDALLETFGDGVGKVIGLMKQQKSVTISEGQLDFRGAAGTCESYSLVGVSTVVDDLVERGSSMYCRKQEAQSRKVNFFMHQ